MAGGLDPALVAAALKAESRDETFIKITGACSLILGIIVAIVCFLHIAAVIRSRKQHSRAFTVLLISLIVGDLLMVPGSIGYFRLLSGWKTLSQTALHAQVIIRDAFYMMSSVGNFIMLVLLMVHKYLAAVGSSKLEGIRLPIILSVVTWIYAFLLVAVIVIHYGLEYQGFNVVYLLLLPLGYTPKLFMQLWYTLNVIVPLIVSFVMAILIIVKSSNAVQPMINGMTNSTPPNSNPKFGLFLVVFSMIFWVPFAGYVSGVCANLLDFKYGLLHGHHFVFLMALMGAIARAVTCCVMLPSYARAMKLTVKCKWRETV